MGLKSIGGSVVALAACCGLAGLLAHASGVASSALASSPAAAALAAEQPAKTDEYGGLLLSVAKPEGFFRAKQLGPRWLFLDPAGHPFWMRAVYAVDWNDGGAQSGEMLKSKYRGDPAEFARNAVLRLRSWGFNTIGEYASSYVQPLPVYSRPRGNSEKMPFIRLLNISWYGSFNSGHLAPAAFKTLLAGAVDPEIYRGWRGHVPDVFDPNFASYARAAAADLRTAERQAVFTEKGANGGAPNPSLKDSPWLIATTPDDADNLFGFGPGPETPGKDGVVHPHIGWVVAVTRPQQEENTEVGTAFGNKKNVRYAETVVYAKRAWHDYLEAKYKTIAVLNSAWGSTYTTFDSDGGWPAGRGLMDESGRNPWLGGDGFRLASAKPAVVSDLNAFLGIFAEKYFQTVAEAIRAATPNHLIFTPTLDSHGGLTRPEILRAAGKYCDVIQVVANREMPQAIDKTFSLTQRPMFSWMGLRADKDSAVSGLQQQRVTFASQAERAAEYRADVDWMLSYRTSHGDRPIVGIDWWEYMDKWGEKANWGLVTPRDNAYDGEEDRAAKTRDSKGFSTGGEDRDYGDFLSTVKSVNFAIDDRIRREMQDLTAGGNTGSAGEI